jgi:hypothetical protein
MRARTTMRQFLTDKRLLGLRFADPSFLPWRVLLMAAWGEALVSNQERAVYRALTNRETTPTQRCDEIVPNGSTPTEFCISRQTSRRAIFTATCCRS